MELLIIAMIVYFVIGILLFSLLFLSSDKQDILGIIIIAIIFLVAWPMVIYVFAHELMRK